MDDIREIILTLSDEERREFRHFLNRIRQKGHRKDLALFDLLQKEEEQTSSFLIKKLYKNENREAYYALRKRLSRQLIDFVNLKSRDNDSTAVSRIIELINLSQYLFDHKKNTLALKYLLKAKEIGEEIKHYELLNAIYNLIINQKDWNNSAELEEMMARHGENKVKLEIEERLNFANSIIKQKLNEQQQTSAPIDFDQLTESVFSKFGIEKSTLQNPRVIYKLMLLSRNAIIASKNFRAFEPFIKSNYDTLCKRRAFTERTVFYEMGLIYFLAHTLYRNKKFDEALKYLKKLKLCLDYEGKSYFEIYYPKYTLLLAGISLFSRDLKTAQACARDMINHPKIRLQHPEKTNIMVSLGIYLFLDHKIDEAYRTLLSIYHTDKWCEKHLGSEWVLKKNLLEVLLYVDLGKQEVAEFRLRSIERKYKVLFRHPLYIRVKDFVSLIKYVVLNPDQVSSDKFRNMVEQVIDWKPFEAEDLQAMGFYAWLKSKMQKRDVYEVWLELAGIPAV